MFWMVRTENMARLTWTGCSTLIGWIMMLLTPTLLCHKDTAHRSWNSKPSTRWGISCLSLCLYGIRAPYYRSFLCKASINLDQWEWTTLSDGASFNREITALWYRGLDRDDYFEIKISNQRLGLPLIMIHEWVSRRSQYINSILRDVGGKIFPFRDIFTSWVFVSGEIRVDKFLVMLHQFVEGFLDKYNI